MGITRAVLQIQVPNASGQAAAVGQGHPQEQVDGVQDPSFGWDYVSHTESKLGDARSHSLGPGTVA